jgi:ABC-type multidrug transport system fused ATPase/permease subunit
MKKSNSEKSVLTTSLLRYAWLHRFQWRALILTLAFTSAVCGVLSPFFQKIFVDRLLGATVITHGVHGFEWLESVEPLTLIFAAFVVTLAAQALSLLSNYIGVREGTILQRDYAEVLYRKMLSLRSDRMAGSTVGEVVSIYATDVPGSTALIDQALPAGAGVIFPLLFAPLAIHWICGIPLFATLLVMGSVVGFLAGLATRQARFFYRFKQLAAERTGLVNEWVQNMRLLRILGWVERFEDKIFRKRKEETVNRIAMVTNGQLMGAFGSSISFVINLVGVASLVYLSDKPVSPGELFALLWIFGVFLARPFRQISWIFTFTFDSISSMRRLERFLARPSDETPIESEEGDESVDWQKTGRYSANPAGAARESQGVSVRGLSLKIGEKPLLEGIDFDVKPGEFVAVVGEVGSGKSLLVLSLMAETGATFDQFEIGGRDALAMDFNTRRKHFAFVPQEGFVMSASLRENVMFRYDSTSEHDAAVEESLALAQFRVRGEHLPEGLDTEIGERGVNLSGGQRQRVSLARAHFFDRPVILLDDCLSALDVDTENQLIRDLIDGAWARRTRVLVTHRLSVLERVDRVFFMEDGRIVEQGTFIELLRRSDKVRAFVASVKRHEEAQAAEAQGWKEDHGSAKVLS